MRFCNSCLYEENDELGKVENNRNEEIIQERKAHFIQFITIISAYIFLIDGGAHMVWTSPSLPFLKSENSHIPLTEMEAAWIVYIINIASIFGPVLYFLIVKLFGRKSTVLLLGTGQLLSWILTNLASNYILLCVAKFTFGLAYCAICSAIPIYIGEIAGKKIRGTYLSLIIICTNTGTFLMAASGAYLDYKNMNLVMTFIPVLALCFSILMLESPYYYLMKGREEEAIKVLMKLSAVKRPTMVSQDIERMKKNIAENEKSDTSILQDLFFNRGGRKAFIVLVITASFSGLSGYLAIQVLAEEILSYSGSSLLPKHAAMILTGMQIFSGLTSSVLIDSWGRRPACLISGILSFLSMTIVGFFYWFQHFLEFDISSVALIPLISLICFMFSCNIGNNPISFIYVGELFPVQLKGIAAMSGGISFSLGASLSNIVLQIFKTSGKIYVAFWIFSVFCILESLVVWYIMPETMGKNLEEILVLMGYKKKREEKNNVC